jgi:hypothetical protein
MQKGKAHNETAALAICGYLAQDEVMPNSLLPLRKSRQTTPGCRRRAAEQQTKTTPPPDSHHYTQPAAAKRGVPVPLTLLVVRPCEVVSRVGMHRSPRLAQAFQLSPFCISNHCDHPGVTPLNRLHTSYSYADKSVDCACCYVTPWQPPVNELVTRMRIPPMRTPPPDSEVRYPFRLLAREISSCWG